MGDSQCGVPLSEEEILDILQVASNRLNESDRKIEWDKRIVSIASEGCEYSAVVYSKEQSTEHWVVQINREGLITSTPDCIFLDELCDCSMPEQQ